MFQIFDCNGRAVGRSAGYAKHATCERLVKRQGSIRALIYRAFYAAPVPASGVQLIYSIRWVDGGAA